MFRAARVNSNGEFKELMELVNLLFVMQDAHVELIAARKRKEDEQKRKDELVSQPLLEALSHTNWKQQLCIMLCIYAGETKRDDFKTQKDQTSWRISTE